MQDPSHFPSLSPSQPSEQHARRPWLPVNCPAVKDMGICPSKAPDCVALRLGHIGELLQRCCHSSARHAMGAGASTRTQASWPWRSASPRMCSAASLRPRARRAGAQATPRAQPLPCGWRSPCTPMKPCSSTASRRCLRTTVRSLCASSVCRAPRPASCCLHVGLIMGFLCDWAHERSHRLAGEGASKPFGLSITHARSEDQNKTCFTLQTKKMAC